MKITFDTKNEEEVAEVLALLGGERKAKTPTEAKEEKPNPKPTPKKKEATGSKIKLEDLKESAKNAVTRTDREKVKETIGNYAPKLAEVSEEDYGKLYKSLQELGA